MTVKLVTYRAPIPGFLAFRVDLIVLGKARRCRVEVEPGSTNRILEISPVGGWKRILGSNPGAVPPSLAVMGTRPNSATISEAISDALEQAGVEE